MSVESPLFWPAKFEGDTLFVLDETLLPEKIRYVKVKNVAQAVKVIRDMKTRAFGQFLVVLSAFLLVLASNKKSNDKVLVAQLEAAALALNKSRPTFPFAEVTSMVVGWAKKCLAEGVDVKSSLEKNIQGFLMAIRGRRLERVRKLAEALKSHASILTHCNVSGELAMAVAICKAEGKELKVFATETRPYFQGAKLTAWELRAVGVHITLVADNAVATLLSQGKVNAVVIGSDRNCANGDIANKIGSYQIAVVAKEFGVPVYVLTQPSKGIATGQDIPIEIRDEKELLVFQGRRIAPKGVKGFYPGFDVVFSELITQAIPINVQ
ncbi:MAG TPA: S-methyl-5-thioribose-1-phosphate isomerase [Candidatus Omnitrophota bacterium]|nr:S-methyl-5-thioribose-1-phosphate isomerase [Candidatus Omnitrophota bacterium]